MKTILNHAIDWMSIKLNAVCLLGFLTGNEIISGLSLLATFTTIIYNSIKIVKELNKNQ